VGLLLGWGIKACCLLGTSHYSIEDGNRNEVKSLQEINSEQLVVRR
jgi:hypothetical protein